MIAPIFKITLICGILIIPDLLWAQTDPFHEQGSTDSSTGAAETQTDTYPAEMEELIIKGERSTGFVRRELFDTQDLLYDMFNSFNQERDYDMVCHKEAHIGSQIKYKVCKPVFMWDAISESSEDTMLDAGYGYDNIHTLNQSELNRKTEYQHELMLRLANENPHFLSLLKKRLALRKEYEARTKTNWWWKRKD